MFSQRNPDEIVAILLAFVVATTIHEFMHAWTAWRLGDDTAARLGRISLNPVLHFDPLGFIGMVLIAIGFFAVGWGKPVPVNPSRFRLRGPRNQRIGMGVVAIAGPLSNVAQAAIVGIPYRIAVERGTDLGRAETYIFWFVLVNILLAGFNLIPIPPLDGSRILAAVLPNFWYPLIVQLERYGLAILFILFFVGRFGDTSILASIYSPVVQELSGLFLP